MALINKSEIGIGVGDAARPIGKAQLQSSIGINSNAKRVLDLAVGLRFIANSQRLQGFTLVQGEVEFRNNGAAGIGE